MEKEVEKIETPQKEIFIRSIQGKYPDLTDEEAIYGHANKSFAEKKTRMKESEKFAKELWEGIEENPKTATFVRDLITYAHNPMIAIVKNFQKEEIPWDMEFDDEVIKGDIENFRKGNAERKLRLEEATKNQDTSLDDILAFAEEKGIEPTIITEALGKIVDDIVVGNVSKDFMEMVLRSRDFDNAVAEAEERGTIAGRNEAIELKKDKDLRDTDGIPMVKAKSTINNLEASPAYSIFDEALGKGKK